MEFTTITKTEFEQFSATYPRENFWQSTQMSDMREHKGWTAHYLGVKEQGEIIACSVLTSLKVYKKYSLFMALRGFLIDYENIELLKYFIRQTKKYLEEHDCLYMKIDPYFPYQEHDMEGNVVADGFCHQDVIDAFVEEGFEFQGYRCTHDENYEPRWMSILDLQEKSEADVLKDMHVRTRQNVNNTIKTGIKVRELARNELTILEKIVDDTGNRRNFSKPDLAYYEQFYDSFKDHMKAVYAYLDMQDYSDRIQHEMDEEYKNKAKIEEALKEHPESKKNIKRLKTCEDLITAITKRQTEAKDLIQQYGMEIPLAAALFVINGHEVVYLFSGSDNNLKKFKGPYAIQWYMIQYAIQHHIPTYNFYGISGDFNEDAEDYGVYLFKKGFHANVVELLGDFLYIAKPSAYKQYQLLRNVKHKILKR